MTTATKPALLTEWQQFLLLPDNKSRLENNNLYIGAKHYYVLTLSNDEKKEFNNIVILGLFICNSIAPNAKNSHLHAKHIYVLGGAMRVNNVQVSAEKIIQMTLKQFAQGVAALQEDFPSIDEKILLPFHCPQATFRITSNIDNTALTGTTSLMRAIDCRDSTFVKFLLESGANLETTSKDGTALVHALQQSDPHITELLLQKKANKETALLWIAKYGTPKALHILLKAKADVNTQDRQQKTPLFYATLRSHRPIMRQLLKANAEVNAFDKGHMTPLMYAAEKGNSAVIRTLLSARADPSMKNSAHQTAHAQIEPIYKNLLAGQPTLAGPQVLTFPELRSVRKYGKTLQLLTS